MAGVKKIDHVAIAVKSIDESRLWFEQVYGARYLGQKENVEMEYIVAYFLMGESLITMLEGTTPESFVTQHIEKRGEGIQHVAFRVENIEAALEELKTKGIRLIDEKPRRGAGGVKIAFLHPKATNGILVELCEKKD